MQTTIPLFGFGGGTGGTGASLTVTAPAGATVTVSKDGKSKTKVADASGVAVFKGLSTGDWTVTITDGEQEAQKTVTITADYSATITFFTATIHVTYPAGSTCTATDGTTTLSAPDTSGTWDCVVPNAGTWTVSLDNGFAETVDVTNSETYTVEKWHLLNGGNQCESVTGGWTNSGYKWMGNNLGNITPLYTEDYVELPRTEQNATVAYLATSNSVRLDGFKYLKARYDHSGTLKQGEDRMLIFNTASYELVNGSYIGTVTLESGTDKTAAIPVSSISGSYRIGFVPGNCTSAKVYEIWLE